MQYTTPTHYGLSVEHAAMARMLTPREIEVVLAMGEGLRIRQIALRLGIGRVSASGYIRDLEAKTRMSWIGLAVMGYRLAGQIEVAAA